MKKRLEAELISIAHRVLKLKNKSEVDQLHKETQKLYETLSILKFYGDGFEMFKAEIPLEVLEQKLTENFEAKEQAIVETEISAVNEVIEAIIEKIPEVELQIEEEESEVEEIEDELEELVIETKEEVKSAPIFKPAFELVIEEETVETPEEEVQPEIQKESKQIAFEDFLGENYADPVFVKPNEVTTPASSLFSTSKSEMSFENKDSKITSLNDTMSKGISIGLNDRIGFVQHLFAESNEDYNRVLSQLNTFDTLEEAKSFVEDMVKPDYNNWQGKEDYAERFMEIVAQKFA
jgi:hypothetical protein